MFDRLRLRLRLCLLAVGVALSLTGATGVAEEPQWPACSSSAGAVRASVDGIVSDTTGARITSATVRIGCRSRVEQVRTDGSGHFSLSVPQGEYSLQVEAAGFAPYAKSLHIESRITTADVRLAVQNASNTVTVQAEAGYVADDSALGTKTDTPLLQTNSVDTLRHHPSRDGCRGSSKY